MSIWPYVKLPIQLFIKCVETGEVRMKWDWLLLDGNEMATWIWREGNYSCDCNRIMDFGKANGEKRTKAWDILCSSGKYQVVLLSEGGDEIYSEFELAQNCHKEETDND